MEFKTFASISSVIVALSLPSTAHSLPRAPSLMIRDPAYMEYILSPRRRQWVRDVFPYPLLGIEEVVLQTQTMRMSRSEFDDYVRDGRYNRDESGHAFLDALAGGKDLLVQNRFLSGIADAIGHFPTTNDLYLIRRLREDQAMRDLFFDRARLLHETVLLRRRAVPTYRADIEGKVYHEDIPLAQLDRLELLRANLLLRMLGEPETQEEIARIVLADLDDPRSEEGGLIYLDAPKIRAVPSVPTALGDGAYLTGYYPVMHNALASFHTHAQGDDRDRYHAGPSIPDLEEMRTTYGTGVVITHAGHDAHHVRFDADIYYIDRDMLSRVPTILDPENFVPYFRDAARVVDLGTYTVER